MTTVVVFRHRPTARDLLADRLARGWRPMPSDLKTGPRVLGYAACVFDADGTSDHPNHGSTR